MLSKDEFLKLKKKVNPILNDCSVPEENWKSNARIVHYAWSFSFNT